MDIIDAPSWGIRGLTPPQSFSFPFVWKLLRTCLFKDPDHAHPPSRIPRSAPAYHHIHDTIPTLSPLNPGYCGWRSKVQQRHQVKEEQQEQGIIFWRGARHVPPLIQYRLPRLDSPRVLWLNVVCLALILRTFFDWMSSALILRAFFDWMPSASPWFSARSLIECCLPWFSARSLMERSTCCLCLSPPLTLPHHNPHPSHDPGQLAWEFVTQFGSLQTLKPQISLSCAHALPCRINHVLEEWSSLDRGGYRMGNSGGAWLPNSSSLASCQQQTSKYKYINNLIWRGGGF